MRRKKIIGLLFFIFITIISAKSNATSEYIDYKDFISLNVGETYTYDVGTFVTSTRIEDESIISYKRDGYFKRKITALSEGKTTINFTYNNGCTTLTVTVIDKAAEEARQAAEEAKTIKENMQKLESQKGKEPPGADVSNVYDPAYWLVADHLYNEGKKTKEMASTDDGLETLKAWNKKWNSSIRGGKEITSNMTDEEKSSPTNVLYTAREWVKKYINANKDGDKIDDAADSATQTAENIDNGMKDAYAKAMKVAAGEDRKNRDVFKNDVLTNIEDYKPNTSGNETEMEDIISKVLTVISNIGIAVAVIMLAVLGIKYMLGSVEEKAEYKEGLIPYVVGAFILFGITGFVKILITFGNKINSI